MLYYNILCRIDYFVYDLKQLRIEVVLNKANYSDPYHYRFSLQTYEVPHMSYLS